MTLCECGCGKEAGKRKQFLQGHYSKYMSKLRKQQPEKTNTNRPKPIKETIMDAKPETIIEEQPEQPEPPYEYPQYQPIPPPNKIRLGIGKIQVSMESVELNMNELVGTALFAIKDLHTLGIKIQPTTQETNQEKSTNTEVNKLHNLLKKEAKREQPPPEPAQPLPAGC